MAREVLDSEATAEEMVEVVETDWAASSTSSWVSLSPVFIENIVFGIEEPLEDVI